MVFDIIFLIIFIWACYKGFTKGLVFQLASLAALILGIFGAVKLSEYLTPVLYEHLKIESEYLPLISFGIIFLVIVILVHLLGKLLEKVVEAVALGFLNRLSGAIFSSVKAAFLISIFLVILNNINSRSHFLPQSQIEQSKMYSPLSRLAPAVFPYLRFGVKIEIQEEPNQQVPV
jgi:membrane protein required for colicin V production